MSAAVPVTVTATATSPTSVTITWTGSTGAASYELLRHGGTGLDFFAPTTGQSYVDNFVVADTAYLYRVRSVDGVSGATSFYSDPDLATTIMFTDDPLAQSITPVKAIHITELRTAVSAVRVLAGLAPFTFTDGSARCRDDADQEGAHRGASLRVERGANVSGVAGADLHRPGAHGQRDTRSRPRTFRSFAPA